MKELIDKINTLIEQTKTFFHLIDRTYFYFSHPKQFCAMLWNETVHYSFWICLFITLFGIIAYILGVNKGKQWAKGSFMAYIVIQLFNNCL